MSDLYRLFNTGVIGWTADAHLWYRDYCQMSCLIELVFHYVTGKPSKNKVEKFEKIFPELDMMNHKGEKKKNDLDSFANKFFEGYANGSRSGHANDGRGRSDEKDRCDPEGIREAERS